MKIIVSGGDGLVGSRIVELLQEKYSFNSKSRKDGFDILIPESFSLLDHDADYFLHLAAKADVDGSESEKELGEESDAWKINVNGTRNVVNFCRDNNIKPIFISTDFVFDGEKLEGEAYTEKDTPNPVNFYGTTKYEGEKLVGNSGLDHIILRIAYPYRKEFEEKKDFVRAILDRLNQGLEVNAVTDHFMCPTLIDDIASVIDVLIEKEEGGIFHAVGGSFVSPYNAAIEIADVFGLDKSLIKPTTRDRYFANKAKRPFNLHLKNDRIEALGTRMKTFKEGLDDIKS